MGSFLYNLAVFNGEPYSVPTEMELCHYNFTDKKIFLEKAAAFHGVVIHYSDVRQNEIFELILSIKKKTLLPVWVKDDSKKSMNTKLNLELGVIGNIDFDLTDEEMLLVIVNTLDLINNDTRRMQLPEKNTETNIIQVNLRNSCLMLPDNKEVPLTKLEAKLMKVLASEHDNTVTYEELFKEVWTNPSNELELQEKKFRIANAIHHIRSKLTHAGVAPEFLKTVRSVGYLLNTQIYNLIDEVSIRVSLSD